VRADVELEMIETLLKQILDELKAIRKQFEPVFPIAPPTAAPVVPQQPFPWTPWTAPPVPWTTGPYSGDGRDVTFTLPVAINPNGTAARVGDGG
jgi:hypothetical protein